MFKKIPRVFFFLSMFLFFLEFVSRFYLFGFNCFNYFKMDSVHNFGVSGLLRSSSNPELIYELKPNLDTYFKLARFKTNSHGIRGKECGIIKPKNTFRIAVIGSSITLGSGVDNEDTFCLVLERRLNAESSSLSYEVINFAVPSYTLNQNLSTLKYCALEYNPDLILFCMVEAGSIDPSAGSEKIGQVYKPLPRSYPFFESFFVKLLEANKITYRFKEEEPRINRKINNSRIVILDKAFSEIEEISQKNKVPVIMLIAKIYCRDQYYDKKIESLSLKHGFGFIDTTEAFKDRGNLEKFWIYKIDKKPNKSAHKIFSEVIYNYLVKSVIRAPVSKTLPK